MFSTDTSSAAFKIFSVRSNGVSFEAAKAELFEGLNKHRHISAAEQRSFASNIRSLNERDVRGQVTVYSSGIAY